MTDVALGLGGPVTSRSSPFCFFLFYFFLSDLHKCGGAGNNLLLESLSHLPYYLIWLYCQKVEALNFPLLLAFLLFMLHSMEYIFPIDTISLFDTRCSAILFPNIPFSAEG